MKPDRWIFFDCDNTLSAIEGVDELARLRPPEVFEAVVALTDRAMNGEIPIDEVFGRRLDLIRPSAEECRAVGQLYIEEVEPTLEATLQALRERGWHPVIVSGGYIPVIRPLAEWLGIGEIEAVDLFFDAGGCYADFDRDHPNTRNGGKAEVVRRLREAHGFQTSVFVGDGISDLEAKPEVDLFIGYGGYVARDAVRGGAEAFIERLDAVVPLIDGCGWGV